MKEKIDKLDLKIIRELDRNSRESYSKTAERLNISKQVLVNRINKLVKKEVIIGFNTRIDLSVMGYTIGAKIRIKSRTNHFLDKLKEMPQIVTIVLLTGDYDMSLTVVGKSVKDMNDIISKIRAIIGKDCYHMQFSFMSTFARRDMRHLEQNFHSNMNRKIDPIDKIILIEMAANSRIQIKELARKTDLSAKAVSQRIKRLEYHRIISESSIIVNYSKIYDNIFGIMVRGLYLTDGEKREFLEKLKPFKVISVQFNIGDVDITAAFENNTEISKMKEILLSRYNSIEDIETSIARENVKRNWADLIR
jgi:Lrp/AsnC family transcriptional regulator, leucine-responsive regulatory protein